MIRSALSLLVFGALFTSNSYATISACVAQSFTSYQSLGVQSAPTTGGCSITNGSGKVFVFSNFTFREQAGFGIPPLAATDLFVTPYAVGDAVGIRYSKNGGGSFTVSNNTSLRGEIAYTVYDGTAQLNDIRAAANGFSISGGNSADGYYIQKGVFDTTGGGYMGAFAGNPSYGNITASNLPATFSIFGTQGAGSVNPGDQMFLYAKNSGNFSDYTTPPNPIAAGTTGIPLIFGQFSVVETLDLHTTKNGATTSLMSFDNSFLATPEPATMALMTVGLAILASRRRKN